MKNLAHRDLLNTLPYPLLPPHRETNQQKFFGHFTSEAIAQPPERKLIGPETDLHAFERCREEIIDLNPQVIAATEARQFATEHRLIHLAGYLYRCPNTPATPLLKAAVIEHLINQHYLARGRVSRQTAAWIWGYLPQLPTPLHLDFDRNLRLNVTRTKLGKVTTHQVRVIAYDYLKLGTVKVTTPLRTALDLLVFDSSPEADRIIQAAINDPSGGCTTAHLHDTLDRLPYLRKKEAARRRLNNLAQAPEHLHQPPTALKHRDSQLQEA